VGLQHRAQRYLKARGPLAFAAQIPRYVLRTAFEREDPLIHRRKLLGRQLHEAFGGEVQEGALKGLKLGPEPTWARADLGPMLLGTYEINVVEQLRRLSKGRSTLVDVGAADGYFAVGCVKGRLFERSVCFEADSITREALRETVLRNGVEDRVTIFGTADSSFLDKIADADVDPGDAVFLIDIEGGEFALLDDATLRSLANARFVIELHNEMLAGQDRLPALVASAEKYFDISYVENGPRDPNANPLLRGFVENDRWLLCSEGRPAVRQRWMVLEPKAKS
jgi:hypothetical protein